MHSSPVIDDVMVHTYPVAVFVARPWLGQQVGCVRFSGFRLRNAFCVLQSTELTGKAHEVLDDDGYDAGPLGHSLGRCLVGAGGSLGWLTKGLELVLYFRLS